MFRFSSHIAFFLLLLFVRVLVPETTVLALHSHEHTEDAYAVKDTGLKLDKKHQHCQIDELFNAPFAPAPKVAFKPISLTFTDTYAVIHSFVWKFTFPNNTDLRGPPIA